MAMDSDVRRVVMQRRWLLGPGGNETQQHEQREPAAQRAHDKASATEQPAWRQWKGPSGQPGWAFHVSKEAAVSHTT